VPTKAAKIELMRGVPLFARCSKRELADIVALSYERDVEAGETIVQEGDAGDTFYALLEGEAKVTSGRRSIRRLGAGDFFGEIALVARSSRTATVTMTSPGRMLVVNARPFRALLGRSPAVQQKVLEALAERLAQTTL
jgi:CRP-like cAMP-binding protein